jgi:hypothetical protein
LDRATAEEIVYRFGGDVWLFEQQRVTPALDFPQLVIPQPSHQRRNAFCGRHDALTAAQDQRRTRNLRPAARSRSGVYGADLETVQFCCTSGHCDGCRDSQAVQTWLLVSIRHFLGGRGSLATWVDLAESDWRQFIWSPYYRDNFARIHQTLTQ